MSIREPNFYREYIVVMADTVQDYIPCMPVVGTKTPITRIPAGSKLMFSRKIEPELFEVELRDHNRTRCLICSSTFEYLLPVHQRH
jgi:hypothetical protein